MNEWVAQWQVGPREHEVEDKSWRNSRCMYMCAPTGSVSICGSTAQGAEEVEGVYGNVIGCGKLENHKPVAFPLKLENVEKKVRGEGTALLQC